MGEDEALIPLVTSVNVACGFHAGDPATIARTIDLAVAAGAVIGAHPGYPDLAGFGRRDMEMAVGDLEAAVRDLAESRSLKLGKVAQPLRAALTGSASSPPIFDVLVALGREESLARLSDQIPQG